MFISVLRAQPGEIDRVAIQPWGCSGLEPPSETPIALEILTNPQREDRPPARKEMDQTDVDKTVEKGSWSKDQSSVSMVSFR